MEKKIVPSEDEQLEGMKLYYCDRRACAVCSNPKYLEGDTMCNLTTKPEHEQK